MVIFQANVCFNVFLGLVTGKVWDFTGFCHVDGIWMCPVKYLVRCVTNCFSKFCHFKWWHAIWSQTWKPLHWWFFFVGGGIFLGIFLAFFCWKFNTFLAISSNSSHLGLFEAISSHFKPFGFFWSHLEPFGARLANLYFLFFFFAFFDFFWAFFLFGTFWNFIGIV